MIRFVLLSLLILTTACSTRPPVTDAGDMMFDHYESRGLNR
jgi:hypothetical protein